MYEVYTPESYKIENINLQSRELKFISLNDNKKFVTKRFTKLIYKIYDNYLSGIEYKILNDDFILLKSKENYYFETLYNYLNLINNDEILKLETYLTFNIINKKIICEYKFKLIGENFSRYISTTEVTQYNEYLKQLSSTMGKKFHKLECLNYIFSWLNSSVKKDLIHKENLNVKELELHNLEINYKKYGYDSLEELNLYFDVDYLYNSFRIDSDELSFIYKKDNETYSLLSENPSSLYNESEINWIDFKTKLEDAEMLKFDYNELYKYKNCNLTTYFLNNQEELGNPCFLKQYFDINKQDIIIVFYNENKKEMLVSDELGAGLIYYLIKSCIIK